MVEIGRRKSRHGKGKRLPPCFSERIFVLLVSLSAIVAVNLVVFSFGPDFLRQDSKLRKARRSTACRYDGNCPRGESCRENGFCLPYAAAADGDKESNNSLYHQGQHKDVCLETCMAELRADEWYYHSSIPIVQEERTTKNGCTVTYQREHKSKTNIEENNQKWTPPTYEEWMQLRFRRLVRVDPLFDERSYEKNGYWNAFCNLPCKTDRDCPLELKCLGRRESKVSPFVSISPKACRIPDKTTYLNDIMIVSGCDSSYFNALRNLAASLRFWAPKAKLVIYNLGMQPGHLSQVKQWPNVHELKWEHGIPNSLPSHVKNLKNYAWKSIVVNETVHEYKSILWLDSGVTISGPLEPIQEILHRDGIFLVRGQDDHMKQLSHPSTYQWFGFDKETFDSGPHFAGGIQGHLFPSRYIDTIVIPNARCALDPTCIAPKGSSLGNHRYDQTSLSILAYQNHIRPHHHTEYLAAGRDQLNQDMRDPNRFVIWTSRGSCNYFGKMTPLLEP